MNSEATREDTLDALEAHPELDAGCRSTSCRAWIPKLDAESLAPVSGPRAALEWCPPGHGDIYGALRGSGMLDALLDAGSTTR